MDHCNVYYYHYRVIGLTRSHFLRQRVIDDVFSRRSSHIELVDRCQMEREFVL